MPLSGPSPSYFLTKKVIRIDWGVALMNSAETRKGKNDLNHIQKKVP